MMGDGPNSSSKWSKYGVEDGKLVRKGEFCPTCGPGDSWQSIKIASLVVVAVIQLLSND